MPPKERDPEKEREERVKQERLDKEERDAYRKSMAEARLKRRETRDREERIRPERVRGGDRPERPRPGQLLHAVDERKYLRFNEEGGGWDEVERHRKCDHWIKKGDPVELHVHECVADQTPTVVFQCQVCQSKYRVNREEAEYFTRNHKGECPTCGTPYPEDQPRDAIQKDFR